MFHNLNRSQCDDVDKPAIESNRTHIPASKAADAEVRVAAYAAEVDVGIRVASAKSTDTIYPDYTPISQTRLDLSLKAELAQRERRGVPLRTLGVRFKDLTTWGAVPTDNQVKTFAGALKRTLTGRDLYEWWIKPCLRRWITDKTSKHALIRNITGLVRDGEMMLVLGRPGSGCTTFLRTITSNHNSYLGVDGDISYSGGLTPHDIQTSYRGDVAYMPEEDKHLPYLTVRQTLQFAFRCKQVDTREVNRSITSLAQVFGISHVLDTIVGDEHIRGISGGERKRLSCVETLATDAMVLSWDGSTRGLDSAATLDFARSLRILTDVGRKATIVSLYQTSNEVWAFMDKVMLLAEGRMIFSGPISEAKAYFLGLGYECGEGRTTADFLTSVTNPGERRFRTGCEAKTPKGAIALEKAFKESVHYRRLIQEVDNAERELGVHVTNTTDSRGTAEKEAENSHRTAALGQTGRNTPPHSTYTISFPKQVVVCIERQWLYIRNNVDAMGIRFLNIVSNALIIGFVFWMQPATLDGAFSRGGFILFMSLVVGFIQLAELEPAFHDREIVERHRNFAFVRPSAVAVARAIVDLFTVFLQTVIFVTIAYWMAGMRATVGAFMTFLGFVFLATLALTALYRTYAALSPAYEVALRYCTLTVLVYITLCGYTIAVETIRVDAPWFWWLSYLNPIFYTFGGIMASEFHKLQLNCSGSTVFPSGRNYDDPRYQTCALPSRGFTPSQLSVLGDDYVQSNFGFRYEDVWINLSIILGMTVALVVVGGVASEWFHWGESTAGALVFVKSRTRGRRPISAVQRADHVEGLASSDEPFEISSGDDAGTQSQHNVVLQKTTGTFSWQGLSYTIPTKNGEVNTLLDEIEGICRPGEMTAFIGVSGAGKTTLLSVLSRRAAKTGTVTGSILVDGLPLPLDFERSIGFCEQNDIHDPAATIREAFTFSALLRQDPSNNFPDEAKIAYVNDVLTALELEELSDALIGSLTLEQKKRTTIGVELCARPSLLLLLDEPTSGLDSQGAYNIVRLLRKLANDGISILCTIHQASQQILDQFDHVLALNPGGRVYYYGPVNEVVEYFEKQGVYAGKEKNVADHVLEMGTFIGTDNEKTNFRWNEIWKNSPERQALLRDISNLTLLNRLQGAASNGAGEFASSTITQTKLLVFRLSRQFWRTPEYPYSRLFSSFLHPLFIGFTFFQLDNSYTSLQCRAFTAFLVLMIMPEFVNAACFRLSRNAALFRTKEYPARTYSPLAFALANIVAEMPYVFLNTVVYWLMWYWPIGFPVAAGSSGYVFLMMLIFQLFSTSWGQWIAALSSNYTIAANIIPFFIILVECLNGILRTWEQLPKFWKYGIYLINPITYFIRGTLAGTMNGIPVICRPEETYRFQTPPNTTCGEYASAWFDSGAPGYLANPGATSDCAYCRYKVADEFLATLNVDSERKWIDLGVFAAFTVLNWVLLVLLVSVGRGDGVAGIWRRMQQWWRTHRG